MRYVSGMDPTNQTKPNSPPGQPIYLIAAHPNWRDSRVNRRLLESARSVDGVDVNDLYSRYPDYCIDVAAEQNRLAAAQLIVLLHPIHWYSMPALQKLWLDDVLSYGWAYGAGGQALRGKDLWLVASTGGAQDSYNPQGYNRYFFDAFLPPYEQTAALCGMRFLPPLLLHGANRVTELEIAQHTETFRQRLQSYPLWRELDELVRCPDCQVPAADRPEDLPAAAPNHAQQAWASAHSDAVHEVTDPGTP